MAKLEKWPLKPTTSPTPYTSPRGVGMCSKCGVRPKYGTPNGKHTYSWCLVCRKDQDRKWRRSKSAARREATMGTSTSIGTRPCARCGEHPREVNYKGKVQSLCISCRRAKKRAWYAEHMSVAAREQQARALTTVDTGAALATPDPSPQAPFVENEGVTPYALLAEMLVMVEKARPTVERTPNTRLTLKLESGASILRMSVEGSQRES